MPWVVFAKFSVFFSVRSVTFFNKISVLFPQNGYLFNENVCICRARWATLSFCKNFLYLFHKMGAIYAENVYLFSPSWVVVLLSKSCNPPTPQPPTPISKLS